MICTSCGTQINAGEHFCSKCGAPVPAVSPSSTDYAPSAPQLSATPILVFGILALAFACTFYFAILGIIFGAIAKSKASAFLAQGGVLAGKAKVGKILGKVGFILGIVFTALLVLVIIGFAGSYM